MVTDELTQKHTDEQFMRLALNQAEHAQALGEVPVGAVLVRNGEVLALGHNRSICDCDPSAHAEIVVLRRAGQILQNYRLPATTLYVTLEPCPMCLTALFHARIERVVYGASDTKTGACGGHIDLRNLAMNHHTVTQSGVLGLDCTLQLQSFFKMRREAAKMAKIVT